ncbi:peptidase inhibitor family I36 protein [Embleya sp. NPDC127516]|uniref:peptidase inhibitor family I36 protein n=1 Tax=Embleya sp. NPDC127516 TaxID=3363990 RepID=UPI0038307678
MRKTLLAAAATALAGTFVIAQPASAQPASAPSSSARLASGSWTGWASTNFSGLDRTWSGEVGSCIYVGDNWNDKIRSAKSASATTRVELWDTWNCEGGGIVIDGSGYYSIGAWVSAYKVTAV